MAGYPSLSALAVVLPAGHGNPCESWRAYLPVGLHNHLDVSRKEAVDLDPEPVQAVLPTARDGTAEHGAYASGKQQPGRVPVGRIDRADLRRGASGIRGVEKYEGPGDVEQRRNTVAADRGGDFHLGDGDCDDRYQQPACQSGKEAVVRVKSVG